MASLRGKPVNREAALENLVIVSDQLAAASIPMFLTFGTLLGALREKDFIAHDEDVDVGVFERDRDAIEALIPRLGGLGFELLYRRQGRLYKLSRRDQEIDFFFAREHRGPTGRRWDLDGKASIPARHLDVLEEIEFLGHQFSVPSDPVAVVKNLYGATWSVPIPDSTSRQDWTRRLGMVLKNPGRAVSYARRFVSERLRWARLARRRGQRGGGHGGA